MKILSDLSPADVGMITGIAFKTFIILADSMPAPVEDCGYFTRWIYDAIQKAASNGLKVGATRPITTNKL